MKHPVSSLFLVAVLGLPLACSDAAPGGGTGGSDSGGNGNSQNNGGNGTSQSNGGNGQDNGGNDNNGGASDGGESAGGSGSGGTSNGGVSTSGGESAGGEGTGGASMVTSSSDCEDIFDYLTQQAADIGCDPPNHDNTIAECEGVLGSTNPCADEEQAFFDCLAAGDLWECDSDNELQSQDGSCSAQRTPRDACRAMAQATGCNMVEIGGPFVVPQIQDGTLPTPAGGDLTDGTYYLTGWDLYPGADPDNEARSIVVVVSGSDLEIGQASMVDERRFNATVELNGTTMILTPVCPVMGSADQTTYSATATGFSIIRPNQMRVEIFTKQ